MSQAPPRTDTPYYSIEPPDASGTGWVSWWVDQGYSDTPLPRWIEDHQDEVDWRGHVFPIEGQPYVKYPFYPRETND